jgi:acyl-CoA hydrolase
MSFTVYSTNRLVKGEDLNHHGTLYAGRTAEWFVECGFVAAATLTNPENIVCLQIHSMQFKKPVHKGEIACFQSQIVYAGTTSLIAHIQMSSTGGDILEGFISFVHVDKEGNPVPHGITIRPESEYEVELHQRAINLREK